MIIFALNERDNHKVCVVTDLSLRRACQVRNFNTKYQYFMGQLALLYLFLRAYVLVSIPVDKYEDRRHVHVFPRLKGARGKHSVAKIWLETNGVPDVKIYESSLSTKENELLVQIIRENWEYIDQQLTKSFKGIKTEVKEITLKK